MLTQVRVDRLSETYTLVIHVEDAVVVLKEVNTEIGLASITSGCDLQHTVSVPIDNVLVLRDHVLCRFNREGQVWHGVVLLDGTSSAPETYWVELWLTGTIDVVHDREQVVHGLLGE